VTQRRFKRRFLLVTGIELIAQERQRQINEEGYALEHDRQFIHGELVMLAIYYAMPSRMTVNHCPYGSEAITMTIYPELFFEETDWDKKYAKRKTKDRLHQLVAAGALIAAEIDAFYNTGSFRIS
jgi:hypothetical protein